MYQLERTGTYVPNGYVVKLYRRAENVSHGAIISESMFMAWMNFDCMDVIGIDNFREYSNSIDMSENPPRETYASWQKMFLYRLNQKSGHFSCQSKEELLFPSDELGEFPLITLSMIKIRHQPGNGMQCDGEKHGEVLRQFLDESIKMGDTVKGELYGSLAVYDYVLVLRGNDYRVMDVVLTSYKRNMREQGIVFSKIYTIAGIDRNHLNAWKIDGLQASVRLSCTSEITFDKLKNNEGLKEAFEGYEVYSILGKYDYDIIGKVKSPQKFVELFFERWRIIRFSKKYTQVKYPIF